MMVIGSERRVQRRNRRSIHDLDSEGRARLRRLLAGARFMVLPTSEAITRVESRLAPGTVHLAVACTAGLGVDQTIAVSEVLAARGYDVTPHLAARQIRTVRHLDEILHRLSRRTIERVLVVQGQPDQPGAFPTTGQLLEAMRDHGAAPAEIGIAGHPEGHADLDRELLAGNLLERAVFATFVSTRISLDTTRLLGWVAEMRVRGLELPVEVGIPGVVPVEGLQRELGMVTAAPAPRRRRAEWYDPTGLVTEFADQQVLDRFDVVGLRVETLNQIDTTAAWRQQIYDLAHQTRIV